jgi:hypothetical protein
MNTKTTKLVKMMLVVILMTASLSGSAQNAFLSLQIARDISGSGLGGNVCPNIAFTYKKHTLGAGPNFQRRKMNYSGMQYNYRYSVAKNKNEKLELYFSGNVIMHNAAYMSKGNIEIEEGCHKETKGKYDDKTFKVFEAYAGIGLKVNFTKNLNAACSSGIGMYHTCNKDYDMNMYRQKQATVLQLRLVLIYNISRKPVNNH